MREVDKVYMDIIATQQAQIIKLQGLIVRLETQLQRVIDEIKPRVAKLEQDREAQP